MLEGKRVFCDEQEKKDFVNLSEKRYNDAISSLTQAISEQKDCRIFTLSGPTCSGKTTTANRIDRHLLEKGKDLHTISIDDFFYDRDTIYKRAKATGREPDFETVDAIDLSLFDATVSAIQRGGEVSVPTFDFKTGMRAEPRIFHAEERDVFLFEGIQAVYPEIVSIIGKNAMFSIYIEADDGISFGDVSYRKDEIRFLRRLVRDFHFRNAAPEFIYELWKGVRANELQNIYPNLGGIDFSINSTMAYDVNMLLPHLVPLFRSLLSHPTLASKAEYELSRLSGIEGLSPDLLPSDSVFREFVG